MAHAYGSHGLQTVSLSAVWTWLWSLERPEIADLKEHLGLLPKVFLGLFL